MRLTALLRDGHTNAAMPMYAHRLPIGAFWTDSGPVVTGASAEHRPLLGARIIAVNGHAIRDVADTIRLYLAHENEMGFRVRAGWILYYPGALRDVGLGTDSTLTVLRLEQDGSVGDVALTTVSRQGFMPTADSSTQPPLYRQRTNEKY